MLLALNLLLAFGQAFLLGTLLESPAGPKAPGEPDTGSSPLAAAARRIPLLFLAAAAQAGAGAAFFLGEQPVPPPAAPALILGYFLALAVLGGAAFSMPGGWRKAGRGVLTGLLFAALASCAYQWVWISKAWGLIGYFSGSLLAALLPLLLAVSLALASLSLLHEDFRPLAFPIISGLLALWGGGAVLALRSLEQGWGYGPRSLTQAARIPSADISEKTGVIWLRRWEGGDRRFEEISAAVEGLDASAQSLERLDRYLKERRERSLFAREALRTLRKGWLLRWEADLALEAAIRHSPGLLPPDYLGALALIRAGPLTGARLSRLGDLAEIARPRRLGFEEVNRSQLIFEAFSAAYARFADEERTRYWLYKVDDLWPIYDKKVEAAPLEGFRGGEISGALLASGRGLRSVKVGLFFIASTDTAKGAGILSQSQFPDALGRFRFSELGAGRYYLGLMGSPRLLWGAKVRNNPGIVELEPEVPALELEPISIETVPKG